MVIDDLNSGRLTRATLYTLQGSTWVPAREERIEKTQCHKAGGGRR